MGQATAAAPQLQPRDANHDAQRAIYDAKLAPFDRSAGLGGADDTTITYMRHAQHCRRLGIDSASRVLDVGCLEGQRCWEVLNTYGCSVTGVDISPLAIERARAFAHPKLSFHCSPAETLPLPGASFTHLTAFDVVEHLTRPNDFIGEAARVLAPGGRLLIHAPVSDYRFSFDWWWAMVRPDDFARNQVEAGHDRRFMPSSYNLRAMLRHEGFAIDRIEWFNGFWQKVYDYHSRRYVSEVLFRSRYRISFDWYRRFFALWPKLIYRLDAPWRVLGCGGSLYIHATRCVRSTEASSAMGS